MDVEPVNGAEGAEIPPLRGEERNAKAANFAAEVEPPGPPPPEPAAPEPEAPPQGFVPPSLQIDLVDALRMVFELADEIVADRAPRWKRLSPKELDLLARGWSPVAAIYLPQVMQGPWAGALLVTAMVAAPRIRELRAPPPTPTPAAEPEIAKAA